MRLANHAAFHTAMQAPVAEAGRAWLDRAMFGQPALPMIDGRGEVWQPGAVDVETLWRYTLDHQVVRTYDFNRAVRTAAREFAQDLFIVTGPGTTLGGAVAQSLSDWRGMATKANFVRTQETDHCWSPWSWRGRAPWRRRRGPEPPGVAENPSPRRNEPDRRRRHDGDSAAAGRTHVEHENGTQFQRVLARRQVQDRQYLAGGVVAAGHAADLVQGPVAPDLGPTAD